jgi:hypothetical protein
VAWPPVGERRSAVDDRIRAFLGQTCNLKTIADYLTGPGAHTSPEIAREAKRFVECVTGLITAQQPERSREQATAQEQAATEACQQHGPGYDPPQRTGAAPPRQATGRDRDDELEPG